MARPLYYLILLLMGLVACFYRTERGGLAIRRWGRMLWDNIKAYYEKPKESKTERLTSPQYVPRDLSVWGPHIRQKSIFEATEFISLWEQFRNRGPFGTVLVQLLEHMILKARRTGDAYMEETLKEVQRLITDLMEVRIVFAKRVGAERATGLQEQHEEAVEIWRRTTRKIQWNILLQECLKWSGQSAESL